MLSFKKEVVKADILSTNLHYNLILATHLSAYLP